MLLPRGFLRFAQRVRHDGRLEVIVEFPPAFRSEGIYEHTVSINQCNQIIIDTAQIRKVVFHTVRHE